MIATITTDKIPHHHLEDYFDYEIDHLFLEQEPFLFGKFILKEKKKNIKFREKDFKRDMQRYMKKSGLSSFSMSNGFVTLGMSFNLK